MKINQTKTLPFFTMALLISFASVNAVLFTPALPSIVKFFNITESSGQLTISIFLIGYAVGQLFYGPVANRFGRKPALLAGITLQIMSSIGCIIAGLTHQYWLLLISRLVMALGSGVGLKMTFTLINECYTPELASKKIALLMPSFAIAPGIGTFLGGLLTTYYGWMGCFYASALYGFFVIALVLQLPETAKKLNTKALHWEYLVPAYRLQFKNKTLMLGGFLMGACTALSYLFAALAPFIAMEIYGMNTATYGLANCIPLLGLILGSLLAAHFASVYSLKVLIRSGILIAAIGVFLMFLEMQIQNNVWLALFIPMVIIYFGSCFILANASSVAMQYVEDKANGAAVMSFINMGFATVVVLGVSLLPIHAMLLPLLYLFLCFGMLYCMRVL